MSIKFKTLSQLKELLEKKELSSYELVSETFRNISSSKTNSFITLNEEAALNKARDFDEGKVDGELAGIPIAQKDLFCTKNLRTTCGSKILENFIPPYDATVVDNLSKAGSICVGKTNMDEFAMGSSNETSYYGTVKNPWGLERVPGGSSGGSAAAVSDNMIPLAIGSQTGGSVLRPASFTGILGLKPTFGTISRHGMSPISQRLDHPGIYANSTCDIDLVASVILSYDEKDLDMIKQYNYKQNYVIKTPKFAFVKGPVWDIGDKDMQEQIIKFVENSPFDIEELNLGNDFNEAAHSHEVIMNGSIAKSLSHYYESEKEKLHPFTKSRIEAGIPVSAKQYIEAIENAKKMQQTLRKFFNKFDAIITPAATGQAPRDLMNTGNAIFNGYWTMMGVPAISLPLLKGEDSLPIGIQIISSWNEDFKLLKIAEYILQETKKAC